MEGLFTTITNVNFDPQTVDQLTESIHAACPGIGFDSDMANLWHEPDEDIRSLKSFVLFSLRGMAAYNYHARVLGRIDPELDRFFCEALQAVGSECSIDALWALVQKTGKASYRCMELLDRGLRPAGAGGGAARHRERAVHRHFRPRPLRHEVPAGADGGQRHPRLHPLGNAPRPRLPGAEAEVPASEGQLRHSLAEPAAGV